MEGLNIDTFLSIMVPLSLYFVFTLLGAFLKDIYNTIIKSDKKFRLSRVLVGSIFGAFFMLALEGFLIQRINMNQLVALSFIVGTVSFELFGKISKLDNIINFIKVFKKVNDEYNIISKEDDDEKK